MHRLHKCAVTANDLNPLNHKESLSRYVTPHNAMTYCITVVNAE